MDEPTRVWHLYDEEYSALHKRFQRDSEKPVLPRVLYHYTTAQGLLGIIREGRVHATSLRYMNDYSELDYAADLLERCLDEQLVKYHGNQGMVKFIERCKMAAIEVDGWLLDAYAFCFSEHGDRLGLWRAYARNGAGYAVGFELHDSEIGFADVFQDGFITVSRREYLLVKVIYDAARQRELLERRIKDTCDLFARISAKMNDSEVETRIPLAVAFLGAELAEFLYSFKHPAFGEEEEWRAVRLNVDPVEMARIEHRGGKMGVTPYVRLDLRREGEIQLRIEEVVQGCQVVPELDRRTLLKLLLKHGYTHTNVRCSVVPLRF